MNNCRSLIGCTFVPRDGAIYCAQCADSDFRPTDDVIRGGVDIASASNESLAGAARDHIVSRQAAITTNHAPGLFRPTQSTDGFDIGCSQDGGSPQRSHVTGGRGFVGSRGSTSRYLDDDNDDSDQSEEVYRAKVHLGRPRQLSEGCPAGGRPRRRQPQPAPSLGRPGNQRRRVKPRAKTRGRVLAVRNTEGYASDTPASDGLTANIRCSGYSSDSIDPTSGQLQQHRRRHVVSTAAQTTGNDVTQEHGGTGNGSRRLMSDAVERYLNAAAENGCSTEITGCSIETTRNDVIRERGGTGNGSRRLMSNAV